MKTKVKIFAMLLVLVQMFSLIAGCKSNKVTISLDKTELTISVDEIAGLNAIASTGDTVLWRSSNDSIAIVSDDGKVKGITPGMATITAYVMVKDKEHIPCDLTIIPCDGWKRNQLFPETGQIFIMPSLGIPRFETVLLYPGTCLIEGTNLSEGRGTSCPFEIIGAPFIESARLVSYLKEKKLPGAAFTPAYFTPTSSKHRNEFCQGVHIHITDYKTYESYRTGLVILEAIRDLYPKEFSFLPPVKSNGRPFISLLSGNNAFEQSDWTSKAILEANEAELEVFKKEKKEYHLYE